MSDFFILLFIHLYIHLNQYPMSTNLRPETMTNFKKAGLSDAQISAISQIRPVALPNSASISQMFNPKLVADCPQMRNI